MVAYIDPGSGAMLLQWLIAGVLGAVVFLRRTIANLASKVFRRKPNAAASVDRDKSRENAKQDKR